MAGAGYKLFNTGDVLTAAQVNTYLMEQTVMVFADAAARTTALTGVVSEGMISYLKDTNAVEVYNGSAWVSSDDPNAIQNTIVDAKGDLITATASDVPARLAVGNNGETLVADSSATTGLRWQSNFAAGKNLVINGDMRLAQRGTSFSNPNGVYTLDRYRISVGTAVPTFTVSQETFTPGTAPIAGYEARNFLRMAVTSQGSSSSQSIVTRLEDVRLLAGQTATFSFWAKAASNLTISEVKLGQNFGSGGSSAGETAFTMNSLSVTTSWQRFTGTVSVPSISGKTIGDSSYVYLFITLASSSGNYTFDTWGWQLEAGSVATAFQTATGTLAGEFAAAQRYFQKSYDDNVAPGTVTQVGSIMAAPDATVSYKSFPNVIFPVPMRGSVTVTVYNPSTGTAGLSTGIRDTSAGTNKALFVNNIGKNGFQSYVDNSSTAAGNQLMFQYTASSEL